jgi:threonine dehydrogenase-like Zn-dependent dehydrogenase
LGHEGWGRIDALGSDVTRFKTGDRVAMLSYNSYAEYDLAAEDHLVRLPPTLDGAPFPGEPLGCAMNVFQRCDIQSGQTVAIVGIGFLGALLTSLISSAGAKVIAISRRPFALELARACGAIETLAMDDPKAIVGRVKEWTDGQGCERVIEAVGQQAALDLATELTRERGRLIIAGYHQDGPRQVNLQLWNWRGLDVINAHERDPKTYLAGMEAAIEAVAAGKSDPTPLYTHSFQLDGISTALNSVRDRPGGFLKALIKL